MPDPLSAVDIAEGRRLDSVATSGPWETCVSRTEVLPGRETRKIVRPNGDLHPWNVLKVGNQCCWPPTTADAELIAWARNHLPALLDAAEKLNGVRAVLAHTRPICDRYSEDDPVSCGWKRAVADVQHAIGEAP